MKLVPPYTFGARIVRFRDADTVVLDVDHGRDITLRSQVYRLPGCNSWDEEQQPEAAAAAEEAVARAFQPGRLVLVSSLKPGKDIAPDAYGGRWVGKVTTEAGDLSELLIQCGWAAPWNGRTQPKPVPVWPRPDGSLELEDLLHAAA